MDERDYKIARELKERLSNIVNISLGKSFAFETTLSGKYLLRYINRLKEKGFRIELIYLFVESVEEAIERIDVRVKKGCYRQLEMLPIWAV